MILKSKLGAFFLGIFIVISLIFTVYGDLNGVWHRAEDIAGGTFGSDEQDITVDYKFINPVDFEDEITVTTIKSSNTNGNVVIQLG